MKNSINLANYSVEMNPVNFKADKTKVVKVAQELVTNPKVIVGEAAAALGAIGVAQVSMQTKDTGVDNKQTLTRTKENKLRKEIEYEPKKNQVIETTYEPFDSRPMQKIIKDADDNIINIIDFEYNDFSIDHAEIIKDSNGKVLQKKAIDYDRNVKQTVDFEYLENNSYVATVKNNKGEVESINLFETDENNCRIITEKDRKGNITCIQKNNSEGEPIHQTFFKKNETIEIDTKYNGDNRTEQKITKDIRGNITEIETREYIRNDFTSTKKDNNGNVKTIYECKHLNDGHKILTYKDAKGNVTDILQFDCDNELVKVIQSSNYNSITIKLVNLIVSFNRWIYYHKPWFM